jgi:PTH1 family peptidyl-tRNA hydrolase
VYCFVGLGNPGRQYQNTRHNLGFLVLDRLAETWRERFKPGFGPYDLCSTAFGGEKILLVKPTTYMNQSGIAVGDLVERYKVPLSRIVVACDDFNLPLGKIRLRLKGSAGGHQGLASVIRFLGTQNFARIRLGIGLKREAEVISYVLSRFSRKEKSVVNEMVETGTDILAGISENGFEWAMNRYNH